MSKSIVNTAKQRLKIIEALSEAGLPTGVMPAPVIPELNSHEIPAILKAVSINGVKSAGYTIVRLNGSIHEIFKNWLQKNFPDRFDKVWHQIQSCHNGKVNDRSFGTRMQGEGNFADFQASLQIKRT